MIHFAVSASASEGQLNVGRIYHQIGQKGLCTSLAGEISVAEALTAKLITVSASE